MQTNNKRWFRGMLCATVLCAAAACGDEVEPAQAREVAMSYARDDLACEVDEDCCAVLDFCRMTTLIVGAGDKARVEELIELADTEKKSCSACMPRPVQVRCQNKRCAASELVSDGAGDRDAVKAFGWTHCGAQPVPAGWKESLPTGGAYTPTSLMIVIGC